MLGDGATSYDLDSTASDWDASTGPWVSQNIQYFPDQENGREPTLNIAEEPVDEVVLGTGGHWTYQDCAAARYNGSYNPKINPNYAIGAAIDPGHGICVLTFDNTSSKTDGGHYALLVVKARTNTTLTLQITVWQ
jgi:hypothetical protein